MVCWFKIYLIIGASDKLLREPLAASLNKFGYMLVVPGISSGSRKTQTRFSELCLQLRDTIQWTRKSIDRYGGDPFNIILVATGQGAHIASYLLLDQALRKTGMGLLLRGVLLFDGIYDLEAKVRWSEKNGLAQISRIPPLFGMQSINN